MLFKKLTASQKLMKNRTSGKETGKAHLIQHLFMGQPHHRGAQVRHAFLRDHTVLPATHAFIHKWNEPFLHCLSSQSWSSFTDPGGMEG